MRVLYATDGSKAALAGAQLLARLPLTAEDELTIVTVLPEAGGVDGETILSAARGAVEPPSDVVMRPVCPQEAVA